jgi:pimeloyl-ACP methyl ester carboxylesterase
MQINYNRRGYGKPLLLVHGLGSSWRSWQPVIDPLARERSVVAIDLPGFGKSPPLPDGVSLDALADALALFLREHDLLGIDAVGSSLGAQLVLELARRGDVVGVAVCLDPGGFWSGWQRYSYHFSMWWLARCARLLARGLPGIVSHEWSRALLLRRLCHQPQRLATQFLLDELHGLALAPSFNSVLHELVSGRPPEGAARGRLAKRMVIGWGRNDRLCHPRQALRAQQLFPDARLHWFERCGHFPHWDAPEETARLILDTTA